MGLFSRNRDRRSERLLDDPGAFYPGEGDFETARFLRALRVAVPASPDPALEAEMIPRLAGAARVATLETQRTSTGVLVDPPPTTEPARAPAWGWRRRVAVLAAAVALLPALMAGLAYAGVALPEPVDDAFDAVGVDLPNQASDRAEKAVRDAGGKEKGAKGAAGDQGGDASAIGGGEADGGSADAAGGNGNDQATGKPGHAGQEADAPGQGGTAPGQGGTIPGTGETTPPSGGSTGPPPDAGPPVTPPGQGGVPPGQG